MDLTYALQYTSLGRIRQDTRYHWWTYSPSRALDTAVTRLRIGHIHLNSHLHKLGMTDDPHCPWCPTQPHTPEHLLLHYPRHHSHHMALLHSLSFLHLRRPTITDLLGGSQDPDLSFKVPQRTGQLNRIWFTYSSATCIFGALKAVASQPLHSKFSTRTRSK